VENKKISPYEYSTWGDVNQNLGNFTKEELMEYTYKALKTFYIRPNYIISQIYKTLLRKDYNLLINGLNFFIMLSKQYKYDKKLLNDEKISPCY
jgi:hypothetical protein